MYRRHKFTLLGGGLTGSMNLPNVHRRSRDAGERWSTDEARRKSSEVAQLSSFFRKQLLPAALN